MFSSRFALGLRPAAAATARASMLPASQLLRVRVPCNPTARRSQPVPRSLSPLLRPLLLFRSLSTQQQFRIEHDTFGEIKVPADRYWAAQTQR